MACIQNQYTLIRFTEPGTTGPGARNGESDCLVPPLGRPPKDPVDNRERKKLARQDELDRIAVEGTFGRAKRRYSMGRLMTKLAQTSETQVAVIMLVMNLEKIRKNLFWVFILAMIVGRKTPKSHFPGGLGYSKMAA
jgi:IS5 family transposase